MKPHTGRRPPSLWLAGGVIVLHGSLQLLWGAAPAIQAPFEPVLAVYGDGLRLVNRWGMFTAPPKRELVELSAVSRHGKEHLLLSTGARSSGWVATARDVRMRKLQSRLSDPAESELWRDGYLAYACRWGRAEYPATTRVIVRGRTPPAYDDEGRRTAAAKERVIFVHPCGRKP